MHLWNWRSFIADNIQGVFRRIERNSETCSRGHFKRNKGKRPIHHGSIRFRYRYTRLRVKIYARWHNVIFSAVFCVNLWCGVLGNYFIWPHLIEGRLAASYYRQFLQNDLTLYLATRGRVWVQHGGAPSRFDREATEFLIDGRWLGRGDFGFAEKINSRTVDVICWHAYIWLCSHYGSGLSLGTVVALVSGLWARCPAAVSPSQGFGLFVTSSCDRSPT